MSTKATLALCLLFIATLSLITTSRPDSPKEKLTHLHFYFLEVESGPNATVVTSITLHRNTTFGDINVFDNTLRVGPQPDSALIGGAQGMGVHAALDGSQGLTAINFFFTAGEYNGSSLATLGVIKASGPSERSIVGGTGKFRFARGYMLSKLVNSTATSLVVEFDMYFTHF
ncbi:Dirigent protein [Rhynchospora pubera]|uniref:Dirigent protein n=1 Tax=Rhynchospora pubera TaxID=906938 RepID=A0AAV8EDD8_9POAL|nr:Dirigent protein [Rhynchospora pubera]